MAPYHLRGYRRYAIIKVTLCDLRKAFIEYLKTNNPESKPRGVLTYDGIHMSPKGNELLAKLLSRSITGALAKRE